MQLVLVTVGLLLSGGLAALLTDSFPRVCRTLSVGGAIMGCLVGLVPTLKVMMGIPVESLAIEWSIPGGAFVVGLDPLSAFFLLPILVLSALAAAYGGEYMQSYRPDKSLGLAGFLLNLLVASMVLVVVARNGLLFIMAWELMTISAFFLVTFEHEKAEVRRAGWVYLVAAHLGVAFLIALVILLGRSTGTLDFAGYRAARQLGTVWTTLFFIFALIGFGAKAGFVPWHVWLPDAHPAAPSHVSAIMSGVMIKTGIYGILRVATILGGPAFWWGPSLVVIGLVGGLLGILLALVQRDMKRVLAYSSIENVGLIALGLGIGMWGWTSGHPTMAALGLAGGLLHVWNHSLIKGLMFFAAGSVLHGTGTRDIERLGGIMRRMPQTGTAMALGAVAISALPPMNGFVSEWLMYMGLMRGGLSHVGISRTVLLLSVGILALIGGLAAICFVRLVGIVLLGEGRSEDARHAHESSLWLTAPMGVLFLLCLIMAIFPSFSVIAAASVMDQVLGASDTHFLAILNSPAASLTTIGTINAAVWLALGAVALLLRSLRRGRAESRDATWGCGYALPTPRMQYTARSFTELMAERLFPRFLRAEIRKTAPQGLFPEKGSFASEYEDPVTRKIYEPFFVRSAERLQRLRWLQQGKLHAYLVYIMVIVVLALAWVTLRSWGQA